MTEVKLLFLFHMHQPYYVDLVENKAIMPWVRLHGTKGYYDIPYMISKLDKTKITVNLVPSLLEQIILYTKREISDTFLDLTLKHPFLMNEEEKFFLIDNFFSVNRKNFIEPNKRYSELLMLRGESEDVDTLTKRVSFFTEQDLIDLQALFNLSWFGFAARHEFEEIDVLSKKQSFAFDDVKKIVDIQFKVLEKIIPLYQRLFDEGKIDISISPYFHPILPLIIDSDIGKVSLPGKPFPPKFSYPSHAEEHIEKGIELFKEIFGKFPVGMWPSEGSVSDDALEMIFLKGIEWIATDEEILKNSGFREKQKFEFLYKGYDFQGKGICFFRDRELSDKIGFVYYNEKAEDAVSDFLKYVENISRIVPKGESPAVSIIFDGENPWEFYPDFGEVFLEKLFKGIEECEFAETTFFSGVMKETQSFPRLEKIWPGSWINANFAIWIGHDEMNTAWCYLGRTADFFEKKSKECKDKQLLLSAKKELMVAEGSDWFWWYGDDFQVKGQENFDLLFLKHLSNVYTFLGENPPVFLKETIKKPLDSFKVFYPKGLISPKIDGKVSDFFEWRNAGYFHSFGKGGAMFEGESPLKKILFGQDFENLYFLLAGKLSGYSVEVFIQDGLFYKLEFPVKKGCFKVPLEILSGDVFEKTDVDAFVCFLDVIEISVPGRIFETKRIESLKFSLTLRGERVWKQPAYGFVDTGITFPPPISLLIDF